MAWIDVPIDTKLFLNVEEEVLSKGLAALENAFVNESGGHTRFPGLSNWLTIGEGARMYVTEWRGDLMAVSARGRVYRIDKDGEVEDVTGVPLTINLGMRPVFAKSDKELLMAAGGQIIRYAEEKTEVLSDDAPLASFVGFIDGYVLAVETGSGLFFHSTVGAYRVWDPLDVFAASGKPDNLNGLIITDFRELLMTGPDSIEQFERLVSGTAPFFRRWAVGQGILCPYTLLMADNAVWGINAEKELVRLSGQIAKPVSDDVARSFRDIDDWTEAWGSKVHILGQKFILMQFPNATSTYAQKGVTFAYDYRQSKWFNLFGWDADLGVPARWNGWSHQELWGENFVGGDGVIYKLDTGSFNNGGSVQRMLGRTANITSKKSNAITVNNVRARIKRGVGDMDTSPTFMLRGRRDNGPWSRWVKKGLGVTGDKPMLVEFGGFGNGDTFQWEWSISDDCNVQLIALQADVESLL